MSEHVAAATPDELLILPTAKVRLHGIDFDEDSLMATSNSPTFGQSNSPRQDG
jgi:hypothetical protein